MNRRMNPEVRKEQLMEAAVKLAHQHGYNNLRRTDIAEMVGVAGSTINHYWGTVVQLKRAVMRMAVKNKDLVIIAQGLALNDKQAKKAPKSLRDEAIKGLIK